MTVSGGPGRRSTPERLPAAKCTAGGLEPPAPQAGAARVANQTKRRMLVTRLASPSWAVARATPTERMTRPSRHFRAANTCSIATRTRARLALRA